MFGYRLISEKELKLKYYSKKFYGVFEKAQKVSMEIVVKEMCSIMKLTCDHIVNKVKAEKEQLQERIKEKDLQIERLTLSRNRCAGKLSWLKRQQKQYDNIPSCALRRRSK